MKKKTFSFFFIYWKVCQTFYLDGMILTILFIIVPFLLAFKGGRGRDRMVVGFTTTYAINDYQH